MGCLRRSNGDEVDPNLVHEADIDALLDDVRPGDANVLVPGDILCPLDGGLDAVGDEGEGRIGVFSNPLLGDIAVGEDDHGRADRVPAPPAVRLVEEAPTSDEA